MVRLRFAAELLEQSVKAALIQHLVKAEPFGEQARRLGPKEQSLNGNVALRYVGGHNEEAKAIHSSLESAVGLLAGYHALV